MKRLGILVGRRWLWLSLLLLLLSFPSQTSIIRGQIHPIIHPPHSFHPVDSETPKPKNPKTQSELLKEWTIKGERGKSTRLGREGNDGWGLPRRSHWPERKRKSSAWSSSPVSWDISWRSQSVGREVRLAGVWKRCREWKSFKSLMGAVCVQTRTIYTTCAGWLFSSTIEREKAKRMRKKRCKKKEKKKKKKGLTIFLLYFFVFSVSLIPIFCWSAAPSAYIPPNRLASSQ